MGSRLQPLGGRHQQPAADINNQRPTSTDGSRHQPPAADIDNRRLTPTTGGRINRRRLTSTTGGPHQPLVADTNHRRPTSTTAADINHQWQYHQRLAVYIRDWQSTPATGSPHQRLAVKLLGKALAASAVSTSDWYQLAPLSRMRAILWHFQLVPSNDQRCTKRTDTKPQYFKFYTISAVSAFYRTGVIPRVKYTSLVFGLAFIIKWIN